MADENAENPLDSSVKIKEIKTNDTISCFEDEIVETKENIGSVSTIEDISAKIKEEIVQSTEESKYKSSENVSETSPQVQKTRKTYENRKNHVESNESPEIPTTSSPNQNTSRYGRARKPKITEDFYNIEDIFGPYERITSSIPRIKSKKLELSPNKSKDSINLPENDISAELTVDIPDDNTSEVSKVMKIVSNNSEFSPKSPSYSSKSVKTYVNKNKKFSDVDDLEYSFINGVNSDENSDFADDSIESDNWCNSRVIHSVNNSVKRTKNRLSLKKIIDEDYKTEETAIDEVSFEFSSSKNDILDEKSSKLVKTTKRLNKLQKNLNIGELKSGRLRSSIAEETEKEEMSDENDDIVEAVPIKEEIKTVEVITIDDVEDPTAYSPEVGDLAWSRVGSYPFWPSIVTYEPETTRCSKTMTLGRRNVKCFHVHFFGDNGRRSWVLSTHIFPFHRRSDLEVMAQSVSKDSKPKDPKHLSAFIINPNKLKKWETAVTEAENITDTAREIRIKKFFDLVSPKKKPKKRKLSSPKSNIVNKKLKLDKKKFKKMSKNITPKSFLKEKKLLKVKTDIKIKKEDDRSIKSLSPIVKEEPMEDKIVKNKTKTFKNKLSSNFEPILESKKKTKISDDSNDSFSDSEIIIKQERETPSPQPQISSIQRHKRINLFRGITKDRVCQICGKNKSVYKCKGNCFGLYHIECDKKIRMKVLSKIEEKSSNISSDSDEDIKKSDENDLTEQSSTTDEDQKKNVSSIVEDILQNVFKTVENEPVEEEIINSNEDIVVRVEENEEICTKSLTIAEQIDLKMQEVMQGLMGDTKYQDSTTDEENEECIIIDPFQTSQSQRSSTEIRQSETSKLDQDEEEIEVEKTNKIKKIIKHVTADGIFDVIEEEEVNNEDFRCAYCLTGVKPPCFICNMEASKSGDEDRHKCVTAQCGKYFHSECLKDWPQTKWNVSSRNKKIENETLSCPYHSCHTCISDNPRGPLSRYLYEKLAKCIRCPTTYHISNYCIPAGTEILSTYQLICPKHLQEYIAEEDLSSSPTLKKPSKNIVPKKIMPHVNASWCFICSTGGSLICCETCPSSFHVECLKLVPPEGKYLCEECESGRLPLYDEIVWVKLGAYRWWPAQILYPADVPPNVGCISHVVGEFVVRFFGSHDHYWVNRGRVFLFQEGDSGHASSKKSAVDGLFVKAIQEATKAHKKFIEERANRAAEAQNGMKPPNYIKIKVNRPVGNVRSTDVDTSNTTPCDCDPSWDEPCGPDSDCLNRILLTECNPMVCAAGSRCCNQSFEKRQYSEVAPFQTAGRGWGLKTLAPVQKGAFVIEYVGEVIDEQEYRRRVKRKHEQKDENYYFLTIDKDRMIDAGPKGNVARFMNHSCSPNCETQKWTINGDTRVGLFAIRDIPSDAELTFNYNLECIGEEKKECRCGAPNCSGFIGAKAKQDEVSKKRKSIAMKSKKKKSLAQEIKAEVNICFVCGEPEAIQPCDRDACNKFYHLHCVSLENFQEGKWLCPWHSCNFCTKRTTRSCYMCINSFCPLHSEGNIRYDRVKGFVCTAHDIKEDEDTELTPEDSTKTKDALKIKKNKKHIRNSVRSSTESSKNIEDIAIIKEDNIQINDESSDTIETKVIINVKQDTDDSSNEEDEKMEQIDTLEKISVENGLAINDSEIKNNTIEEDANKSLGTSNELLQIDIYISSVQNNTNKNSAIKKRKSRLSLKKNHESVSNSSQEEFSEEDRPLVARKKMKLSEDTFEDKTLIIENDEETAKKSKSKKIILKSERSLSQTDLQFSDSDTKVIKLKSSKKQIRSSSISSETPESDFKQFSQTKGKKNSSSKITNEFSKINSVIGSKNKREAKEAMKITQKMKNSLKNNLSTPKVGGRSSKLNYVSTTKKATSKLIEVENKLKNVKVNSTKIGSSKVRLRGYSKKNIDLSPLQDNTLKKSILPRKPFTMAKVKPDLALYKANMRRSIRNLKQYQQMKFSDDETDEKSSSNEEKNVPNNKNDTTSSSVEDVDSTKEESKNKEDTASLSVQKKKMGNKSDTTTSLIEDLYKTIEESNVTKDSSNELSIKKKKSADSLENVETNINSKIIKKNPNMKKKKVSSNNDNINDTNVETILEANQISTDNPVELNIKNNSVNNIKITTEVKKIAKEKKKNVPSAKKNNSNIDSLNVTIEKDLQGLQKEENMLKLNENTEKVKRKRGRPRKHPLPLEITIINEAIDSPADQDDVTLPEIEPDTLESSPPHAKRLKGRPKKQTSISEEKQNFEQVTELYKMKLNENVTKNPFDAHVKEVKLTSNVPERHLRVVLRKNSEIDSKIDKKFIKMQNDIESNLPIRKRSKLRYEAQL